LPPRFCQQGRDGRSRPRGAHRVAIAGRRPHWSRVAPFCRSVPP
jgi:hypothetical protein